jgi:hypothetical protein
MVSSIAGTMPAQRAIAGQKRLFCFDCGAGEPRRSGLCRSCYGARLRSRYRFAGHREAVLDRDGHCCRICGGRERIAVHHRRPGRHDQELLISVCVRCHARLHRLAALRRWVPALLAELWQEAHPGVPIQLQFPVEAHS